MISTRVVCVNGEAPPVLPHTSVKVFRYFIYLPHDYNNYKKMPKKNEGRDGEEA